METKATRRDAPARRSGALSPALWTAQDRNGMPTLQDQPNPHTHRDTSIRMLHLLVMTMINGPTTAGMRSIQAKVSRSNRTGGGAVTPAHFDFDRVCSADDEPVRCVGMEFSLWWGPVDLSLSLGFSHPSAPPLLPQYIYIYCSLILIPRKMEMSSESDAKSLLACSEYMGMNCIALEKNDSVPTWEEKQIYSQRDRS